MSGQKKIIQVISHLELGGAEKVALDIVDELRQEFSFHVFAVLESHPESDIHQALVKRLNDMQVKYSFGTRLPFKFGGAIQAAFRLRKLSRGALLHLHTEIPDLTAALSRPLLRPETQILRTIHNTRLWGGWERVGQFAERRLQKALIASVSESALQAQLDLRQRCGIAAPQKKQARVIYNGVGLPIRESYASRCHNEPVRVLFAGRLERQKGADLLPEIVKLASALARKKASVTIAGDGSLREGLARRFTGISDHWTVSLSDPIPNLSQKLADFDLVLMPSRFEGLPLLAIEALLTGLPVVASDADGLNEVVNSDDPLSTQVEDVHGTAQVLANAIDRIEMHTSRVRANRSAMMRKFGRDRMGDSYRQVYREMLQDR